MKTNKQDRGLSGRLGLLAAVMVAANVGAAPRFAQGVSVVATAATADAPVWGMSGGDPGHTNQSSLLAPQTNIHKFWKVDLGANSYYQPVIGADGTIYVTNDLGQLIAVSPQGQKLWTFSGASVNASSPAIGNDGTIYFGTGDYVSSGNNAYVYAVNPDGTKHWQANVGSAHPYAPVVDPQGRIHVTAWTQTGFGTYYCLNPNGSLAWSGQGIGSPALLPSGSAVVQTGTSYRCYDSSGKTVWTTNYGYSLDAPMVAGNGDLYAASYNANAWKINPATGAKLQTINTGLNAVANLSIDDDAHRLYLSSDTCLRSFDLNGNLQWSYPNTGGRSGPALIDAAGNLLSAQGQVGNGIDCISSSGSLRWHFSADESVHHFGMPTVGNGGVVYATNWTYNGSSGYLYAVVPEPSALALLGAGIAGLGLLIATGRREKRGIVLSCLMALACMPGAANRLLAAPTIIATDITGTMIPPAIDWHDRILNVHIRNGQPSLVTCSGGQVLDSFQPGQDLFSWTLSQYGVAYVQRPQVLYVRPAGGESQFVYSAPTSMGCLAMNDNGTVCYASRDSAHTGLLDMWIRQPNQSAVRLASPISSEVSRMAIDPAGNVYAGLGSEIYRWSDGSWANLTADWSGSAAFAGMNRDGSRIFFMSSEPGYRGLYQLCGDTISQMGITCPLYPSPTVKVGDNGSVLVYWRSDSFSGVSPKAYVRRPDGSVVDLDTVVPAGQSLSAAIDNGHLDMNHAGQILIEAASTGSGSTVYDYYRYNGDTCQPLLETTAAVLNPAICDDGMMYYYIRGTGSSAGTVTMAAVPEPSTFVLLGAGVCGFLAVACRRRFRPDVWKQFFAKGSVFAFRCVMVPLIFFAALPL